MAQDSFELACDRLSGAVDGVLFERLRWARTEGPMLARLVELAQSAVEERGDFELTEESSTSEIKRFVLKVHSNRVVAITIRLDQTWAVLGAEVIERSPYRLSDTTPLTTEFQAVDEQWMASSLQEIFARIQS
jgi:hypothetical protein